MEHQYSFGGGQYFASMVLATLWGNEIMMLTLYM